MKDDEARAKANAAITEDRTQLVRTEMERLRAILDDADLFHLRRAEMGLPLIVLGWDQHPDGSGQASLAAIEAIIDKLYRRYEDDPPGPYHWPDLRGDLKHLQARITDLREALAVGQVDNAIGRAIAVGTGIGRLGYWLLAGSDAAGGAKNRFDGAANGLKATEKRRHKKRDEVCEAAAALHREHPTYKRWRIAVDLEEKFKISKHTIYPWLEKIVP